MEQKNTKDNNKKKYRLIKKGCASSLRSPAAQGINCTAVISSLVKIEDKGHNNSFCKFKTNQKNFTNQSQLNDGLVSSAQRFYKNSTSLPVKRVENKMEPQQGVSSLLKKNEKVLKSPIRDTKGKEKSSLRASFREKITAERGEGKAKMQLEELKNKFINLLMRDGEKSKASKLFAHSLKQIESQRVLKNLKVFNFFTAQKKHLLDLDQKQHKQKKEKKNNEEVLKSSIRDTTSPAAQGCASSLRNPAAQGVLKSPIRDTTSLAAQGIPNKSHRKGHVEENYYNDFLKKNILYQAVENIKPYLELRRVRKGGTTYQVPAIVSQKRQERLAIKWIIESAEKKKKKNNNSFSNCLVSEILDGFNKIGQPRQRRDEQLKIAEFNRAYTRYRWW